MKVVIHPSQLSGTVRAPASKSSMQRALAAAFLAKETCRLHNPGYSNDDLAAMDIIRKLGAKVEIMKKDNLVLVEKGGGEVQAEINCGESGLSLRMFAPIAALSDKSITIHGERSLLNRPVHFFEEILPQLGVTVETNNGRLPVRLKGPLQPKNIEMDGSLSSQFLTGLLMAYSAAGAMGLRIKVSELKSRPYIDLTLGMIRHFGLGNIENKGYAEFLFHPVDKKNVIHDYTVESDWSSGAFLLVAGAIAGPITIRGLDLTSVQADKAVIDVLMAANAGIAVEAKGIKIHPAEMTAFEFDATDSPDLFPPLVSLAAYCRGETRIKGVGRLTHKESNRALTLQEEFGKMGVEIAIQDDVMIIRGGRGVRGARVHSHHDHRIAMACAVTGLKAEGDTLIDDAWAVKKSYPDFYSDLKLLGAAVSLPSQHFNL